MTLSPTLESGLSARPADRRVIAAAHRPTLVIPRSAEVVAVDRLRRLLEQPTADATWWSALAVGLDALGEALWQHRADVEGPGGLHAQILADAPRLAPSLRRLTRDHVELGQRLRATRLFVGHTAGDPDGGAAAVTAVRDLLVALEQHQVRARAVLSDTYLIDIGGE